MILQNWHNLSRPVKGTFLTFCAGVAIGGGLVVSAYSLAFGLNLSVEMPRDIGLWPKIANAGYTGANTVKWIKISGIAGLTPALTMAAAFLFNIPKGNLHGDARFASDTQIKKMGLRSGSGVLVGFSGRLPFRNYGDKVNKLGFEDEENGKVQVAGKNHLAKGKLLSYDEDEHVFLYAPTRSGKGVGVVVPTLLNWTDSVVVLDIKKENWNLTAGFRKSCGQDVFLFDPLEPDGKTHCWNPLSSVRRGTEHQANDLRRLATLFFPVSSKDTFFDLAAQAAFVGVAGYLAESKEYPFTLGEIYRQLTLPQNVIEHFQDIIEKRMDSKKPFSIPTLAALNDFISKSEKTFSSVQATITANLGMYGDPILDRATSRSDFDFADLRRKRMSIYLGITARNLVQLSPLINLFFQSCADANTDELPEYNPALKHKVLFCLDEFALLGEMPIFEKGIAFFAGYGLKILTVVQTPAQIRRLYTKDGADSYISNAGIEVVFTPKNITDAKELSETLGYSGMESSSMSRAKHLVNSRGATLNTSEQRRALMLPQELLQMDRSKALILSAGHRPILANKLRFYAEQAFLDRILPAPQIESIKPTAENEYLALQLEAVRQEKLALKVENERLAKELLAIKALAKFQKKNVESGQPANRPMTEDECTNPVNVDTIVTHLDDTGMKEVIQEMVDKGEVSGKNIVEKLF